MVCSTLLLSFPAMDFNSGQLNSLKNPIHRIPGLFVNKRQILFCDRALLKTTNLLPGISECCKIKVNLGR